MTKLTMIGSAIFTGILGVIAIFLPEESLTYFQIPTSVYSMLMLQLLGALYLGNAMLNWMSKNSLLGGIYGRPILIFNFSHFFIGAVTLIKILIGEHSIPLIVLTTFYTLFGLSFVRMLFFTAKPSVNN